MRIGHGYDVHRLEGGRKLILGGVHIPCGKGLSGHSDADVLVHAVMDALLGAAALGDIGQHFPDSDEKFHGADSIGLLCEVFRLITEKGYHIGNIDATIIAQEPKLSPYLPQMIQNIAAACRIEPRQEKSLALPRTAYACCFKALLLFFIQGTHRAFAA